MNFILFALQALPALIEAVKAVEAAVPAHADGKAKLNVVLDTVSQGAQFEETVRKGGAPTNEKVVAVTTGVTSLVVSLFNSLGVFKRKSDPSVAAPAV